jgi:hypothetical protein
MNLSTHRSWLRISLTCTSDVLLYRYEKSTIARTENEHANL